MSLLRWPGRASRVVTVAVGTALAAAVMVALPALPAAQASCANPIACENQLPGTPPSVWDVGVGEGKTIEGFADSFSVNVGGSINFKIKSPATAYAIDIYRMGYYGGDGARLVAPGITPSIPVSQSQPVCNSNPATGLIDCGNWGVSATWNVPATAVSGVYFARIYRTDGTSDENQIPFVVTSNASHSDVVFMTDDETWQAYNDWGGNSLYAGNATLTAHSQLGPGRAVAVSYNRPFATRFNTPGGRDFFFATEFPMVRFMERNGYNVSYVSQQDVAAANGASMLEQHKMFVNVGHSEYWDAASRANLTTARNAGLSLAFFAGNLMWWKTRWAASQFGNEPNRTLITYKESLDTAQTDPADPPTWTGAWRDPRFSPPADGGQPENALTGQLWFVNCCSYAMQVPSAYANLRFWRNTAVASLPPGSQPYMLPPETLGYEWDSDVDNGFRPPGQIDMSKTTQNVAELLLTVNEQIGTGSATHSLTLYRAASGALVFNAGTVQWSWGLDATHDGNSTPTSPAMQQATVNLFADMGAQPATLAPGLVAATASADHSAPTSAITSPAAGATVGNGSTVTVSGTAADSGGGVVAGVEVSTNGGSTWHPATTMSAAGASVTWSYTWSAAGSGPVTIMSRATDDSGNIETPGPGRGVTVNCPCGFFGANYVPVVTSANDSTPLELGMKFQSSLPGWVAGVRFYKGAGNIGTHTGSLWTSGGTQLATGTFTGETASGWQTLQFANPVQISANTTYVVSYYDPAGHYADESDLFDWAVNAPPLTAPRSVYIGTGGGNGVFNAGGPGFPTSTFQGSSYAVDVIFDTTQPPGAPPAVTGVTPFPGSSSNPVSTTPTATFSTAVVPGTTSFTLKDPNGTTVPGSTALDGTNRIVTFTPTSSLAAGTKYTATVSGAQDKFGQTMTPYSYTFITSRSSSAQCPCSVWPDVTPPGAGDAADTSSVELGVTVKASTDGTITGVRFYKEPDNTGSHTGSLWSSTGTLLATGTFSGESSQGWQQLDFTTPVTVTAGTTYVASYHTTAGHYAVTPNGLGSAVTNGPLTALASGGVYAYSSTRTFPANSYNGSNYWVDVVYQPKADTSPPAVASSAPSSSATSVPVGSSVTVTFDKAVQPTPAFTLTGPNGTTVPGTSSLNGAGTVLTFSPSGTLSPGAAYTVSVRATSASGVIMPSPATWTFTTSGASACPCTLFESDATPGTTSANDSGPVELGAKFQADTSGWISGVRFYKGAGNTGTHVGSLWTDTGTLLAHGTFTNETATGWQTLHFPNAVQVNAGQTYVAGYFAPNGHYAADAGYFSSGYDNSPLHAPSSAAAGGNGLFAYGSSPTFPSGSFGAANYWVDPIFWSTTPPDLAGPGVDSTSPVSGQTSVPTNTSVSFTFDKAVQPSTIQFALTGPGGTSVPGSVTYDAPSRTATFVPTGALFGQTGPLAFNTAYSARVSGAQDTSGTPMGSPFTWSFTTANQTPPAGQCPCSIWPDATEPSVASANDQGSVELGVKFTPDAGGWITGIRFYKGPANTGSHVGSLWTASGTLLGQVTFSNESTAGWQQATFSAPIQVTANTTYVASYLAPKGGYSVDSGGLTSSADSPPLHALSSAVAGGNGLYLYSNTPAFPTNSFNASNYWVDVVFSTTAP